MMFFESGIETLPFTPPQPLSFTQQYVLIEGLCVSLVALFSSFSHQMVVSFEPVQYEAKFHLWVQHTTLAFLRFR